MARLPVRLTAEDRYFNDPFEGLPAHGYTRLFENLLLKDTNIDVRLNVDYFKVKKRLPKHKLLIFTGPIDAFYADQGWQKLEYRSIFFEVIFRFVVNKFLKNHCAGMPRLSIRIQKLSPFDKFNFRKF